MQGCGYVAWGSFGDVTTPPKLGAHLLELSIGLGKLALKWLQECEQMLWSNTTGPEDLKSTALYGHDKLSFDSSALAHCLIPGQ